MWFTPLNALVVGFQIRHIKYKNTVFLTTVAAIAAKIEIILIEQSHKIDLFIVNHLFSMKLL